MFGTKTMEVTKLRAQVVTQNEVISANSQTIRDLRRELERTKFHAPSYYPSYRESEALRIASEIREAKLAKEVEQLRAALKDAESTKLGKLAEAERNHNVMLFAQQLMLTRFGLSAEEALIEARTIYAEVK